MSAVASPAADGASQSIVVRRLGTQPYAETRAAMIAFTQARTRESIDEIWLLEHPPVYTLGQAGRLEHLHRDGEDLVDIPVVQTERGGQITYHGPGQLVAYLLIDLARRGIKVREFVQLIEASVIDVLAAYNLAGRVKPGAPGVYVEDAGVLKKIAALGLKIVGGRSFHGLSLNVAMDLRPYRRIDACGFPGLETLDLAALGVTASTAAIGEKLADVVATRIEAATRRAWPSPQ